MLTKYNDTKIWALKYNNSDVSELKIDGSTVWKSPLEYTLLSDGTYSVKARVATQHVVGDENEYEDGSGRYYCQFIKPIDDALVDPTSPSLSVNVIAGTNVTSIDSVGVLNGHIIVFAYVSHPDITSSIDIELRDLPETLVIPSTFNGKAVTKIEEGGFKNCTKLKRLIIPDSVTTYGDSTYNILEGSNGLEVLAFKPSSHYSPKALFGGGSVPTSLSTIIISGNSIPGSNNTSWCAFLGLPSTSSIYIPSSVTNIGDYAFRTLNSPALYCEASSKQSGWESNWNKGGMFGTTEYTTKYSATPPTYVTG